MEDHSTFNGNVILTYARKGGNLSLFNHLSFAKKLIAPLMIVGSNLVMDRDVTFNQHVILMATKFGGSVFLSGTFANLQLSGAVIAQELNILDLRWRCSTNAPMDWTLGDDAWEQAPCPPENGGPSLVLRNVQAGEFQDDASVWPPSVDLEGFHYERIGGFRGTGPLDMRARSPEQWNDWLARNAIFTTQPYTQLAGVLLAAGRRDTAERVQFAMRERERREARRRGDWAQWTWLTTLCFIAGYGIGLYTFRVLWCVLVLVTLGVVVLRLSPIARRYGLAWQVGASLHRLLPVVELYKGFKDFFDNPVPLHIGDPRNLSRFQSAFFAGFAIAGWILGIFLIAALGGLMPKG